MKNYLILCSSSQEGILPAKFNDAGLVKYITTKKEYDDYFVEENNAEILSYDRIIIFAELWEDEVQDKLYGLSIAVNLRLQYCLLVPICILSKNKKDELTDSGSIEAEVLLVRGTCFKQVEENNTIPAAKIDELFEPIVPLSPATLVYISSNLNGTTHVLGTLEHSLIDSRSEKINKVTESLECLRYLEGCEFEKEGEKSAFISKVEELKNKIIESCKGDRAEDFDLYKGRLLDLIRTKNVTTLNEQKDKHKILLLEDNKDTANEVVEKLKPFFDVTVCHKASDALDAMKIDKYGKDKDVIKKDKDRKDRKDEYRALICDWQLLAPNGEDHQELLGFEVLEYAARLRHYALFSLTTTNNFRINEMHPYLNVDHIPMVKDFRNAEAFWNVYIPIIQQRIEYIGQLIASIPNGASWDIKNQGRDRHFKSSYRELYTQKRNSPGWSEFERGITEKADLLWAYYSDYLFGNNGNPIHEAKAPGLKIKRKEIDNILILRRIYLALWFNKNNSNIEKEITYEGVNLAEYERLRRDEDDNEGWRPVNTKHVVNIYSILKKKYFKDDPGVGNGGVPAEIFGKYVVDARSYMNKLAIRLDDLKILPEEKQWLESQNIKIYINDDDIDIVEEQHENTIDDVKQGHKEKSHKGKAKIYVDDTPKGAIEGLSMKDINSAAKQAKKDMEMEYLDMNDDEFDE